MNLCIEFFVDGPSTAAAGKATASEQKRQQLSTLLSGIAEDKKAIIIDFSLNETHTLLHYASFKAAWMQLDISQREFIAAFRHLQGMAYIDPHSSCFDEVFFCDLVRERFYQQLDSAMAQENTGVIPYSQQILLANRAHRETAERVGTHNAVPSYEVINQ
ncbi:hypothetical protein ACQKP8_23270 [Photobacterium alginatilyticum]|uniref:hypothetical protein n=1 Tax=Photobacterium alginatilyticum TaxID=1775171 RepID=UPI0040693966